METDHKIGIEAHDRLLWEAIEEREKGIVVRSIVQFRYLVTKAPDAHRLANVLNHLGLAYFHAKNYIEAVNTFTEAYIIAKRCKDLKIKTAAMRNLSAPELAVLFSEKWRLLNTGLEASYRFATEARVIAKERAYPDCSWYTHRVLNLMLISNRGTKEDHKKLLWQELSEYIKSLTRKVSATEHFVWLGGLMKDFADIYSLSTKENLKKARAVMKWLKLMRRVDQIDALLEKAK
jgi:tetratricopeptide (TPR) repeat protein